MSQVAEMLRHVSVVRERLRNPSNAVMDTPINLKRREVVAIQHVAEVQSVPVNSWEIFGPKHLSAEEMAFGPVVHPEPHEPNWRPSIPVIQRLVARTYGLTRNDILSARRTANIVRPRQVAMYLAKTLTLRSLPEIGRMFGHRDHTTVLHSVRKITALRLADAELNAQLVDLENLLVASPSQTEDASCSSALTTTR